MEYRGFNCQQLPNGKWKLVFPNGFKTTAPNQTEENLKQEIDTLLDGPGPL